MKVSVSGGFAFPLVWFDGNGGRVFGKVDKFGNLARDDVTRDRLLVVVGRRLLLGLLGRLHRPLELVEGRWVELAGEGTVGARHRLFADPLPDRMIWINSDDLK